jgi:hypothetical protein
MRPLPERDIFPGRCLFSHSGGVVSRPRCLPLFPVVYRWLGTSLVHRRRGRCIQQARRSPLTGQVVEGRCQFEVPSLRPSPGEEVSWPLGPVSSVTAEHDFLGSKLRPSWAGTVSSPVRPSLISCCRGVAGHRSGRSARLGKTTLVSQLQQRSPLPRAWLSLDALDNDPAVLLAYLARALEQIESVRVQRAAALVGGAGARRPRVAASPARHGGVLHPRALLLGCRSRRGHLQPTSRARLYVSRNTVKSQAVSTYRKLGVSAPSEDIRRAEEVGLLSR